MSWQKESEELEARRSWSREMGGSENVERHHGQGKLTIRERIDALVDGGSFTEVGSLSGTGEYDEAGNVVGVQPAPYIMGVARVNGRPVAIGGEDFTVRGGSSPGTHRRKGGQGGFIEDLASKYLIPLINLADGAGGSVRGAVKRGYTVFPGVSSFGRSVQLLGEVPVVSAVLGSAAGGPAGRAILSHWSVMVRRTSQIFSGGPPLVRRALGVEVSKDDLGGHPRRGGHGRHGGQRGRYRTRMLLHDPAVSVLHAAERMGTASRRVRRRSGRPARRRAVVHRPPGTHLPLFDASPGRAGGGQGLHL